MRRSASSSAIRNAKGWGVQLIPAASSLRPRVMRSTVTALATCLVLALAACGGDDDDDGEAEFLSQVNAICAEYRPKLELLQPPAEFLDEWAAVGADMADLLEASVKRAAAARTA